MIVKEREYLLDELQVQDKCKSIERSTNKLQSIIRNCCNQKFINLDKWLKFEAECFLKENSRSRQKYFVYKQGTIVLVNFGTSIGAELSGYHFAIILNKNDNNKNSIVNVLPLTSKDSKFNLSIGYELYDSIFGKVHDELLLASDINNKLNTLERFVKENKENWRIQFDENSYQYIIDCAKNELSESKKEEIDINDMIKGKLDLLKQCENFYQRYNKESFAKISYMTTISKYRILKPLNSMDPIGRITLSEKTMSFLNEALYKFYI